MKNLFYVLLVVCMAFVGCNKASDISDEELESVETTTTVAQEDVQQNQGQGQKQEQEDQLAKYFDLLEKCKKAQEEKNFQEAAEIAKQMIAIDENNCIAFAELGRINIAIGQLEEAKKYLEKANSLNPNDIEVQKYYIELNFENLVFECKEAQADKNYQEAIDIANKLINLNQNNCIGYAELGHTYSLVGNKSEAKKYLEKALSLSPNDVIAKQYLEELQD